MDYKFFNPIDRRRKLLLKAFSPLNKLFDALRWPIEVGPGVIYQEDMITVEQRMNLFHLLNDVLIHKVDGDLVEFGCYTGKSAVQIQAILSAFKTTKKLFVFDKFGFTSESANAVKKNLIRNFENTGLEVPEIIEGLFADTIPEHLPARLAFIHIDCGWKDNSVDQHKEIILHLLANIYTRMSSGAICLLMDYHDCEKTVRGHNSNPGVKAACDIFFARLPEKVDVLYGNHFSHGYFRKM